MIITVLIFLFLLFVLPFMSAGISPQAQIILFLFPIFLMTTFSIEHKRVKKKQFKIDFFFILWLAFLFAVLVSSIFSISIIRTIPAIFNLLAVFILAVLSRIFFADKKKFYWLSWTILAVGFLLCLWSAYYLISGVKPLEKGFSLVYAIYGHNNLSDYLLFCLPISLVFFLKEKKGKLVYFLLLLIYFVSFIATFARGAWLVFLILPILLYIADKSFFKTFRAKILIFILLTICVFSLFVLIFLGIKLTLDKENIARKDWFGRQFMKAVNWEKRPEYWRQSLKIFSSRPLTGTGLNTFYYGSLKYQRNPQNYSSFSHNYFLQLLSETGIFGFLLFAILIGYLFFKAWSNVRHYNNSCFLGLWSAAVLSFLHIFIDYDWNQPVIFLTAIIILATVSSFNPKNRTVLPKNQSIILFACSFLVFLFGCSQLAGIFFYGQAKRSIGERVNNYYKKTSLFYPWNFKINKEIMDFAFINDRNFFQQEVDRNLLIDRNNPEFYQFLANKYKKNGEVSKTREYLETSLYYHPLNFENWLELMSLEKSTKGKKIIFEQIMEKTKNVSNFDIYHRAMGKIYWEMSSISEEEGNLTEAINYGEMAISIDTWRSDYYLRLKDLYLKNNDLNKALLTIEKCRIYFASDKRCISVQKEIYDKIKSIN